MTPTELKRIRKALNYSQAQFAKEIGYTTGRTVRRLEAGEYPIPKHVAQYCEAKWPKEYATVDKKQAIYQ